MRITLKTCKADLSEFDDSLIVFGAPVLCKVVSSGTFSSLFSTASKCVCVYAFVYMRGLNFKVFQLQQFSENVT